MDALFLRDMTVYGIVGVNPEERVERQPVLLNVELGCDLSAPCLSDRLEDTLNYKSIHDRIVREVETSQFLLLERLAQRVADLCLEDPRVQTATVTLDKPRALRFARAAGVRITRSQPMPFQGSS